MTEQKSSNLPPNTRKTSPGRIVRNTSTTGRKKTRTPGMRQSVFIRARNAPPASADNIKALDQHQRHISENNSRVTETVRRMKAMYQAGSTLEEISEQVPCWVDDSGWSEESIGIIVGVRPPMNWSFLKRMV